MQSVAEVLQDEEGKVPETPDELRDRLRRLNDVSEFRRRITPVDGPVVDGDEKA
jgi:hypothetical protein